MRQPILRVIGFCLCDNTFGGFVSSKLFGILFILIVLGVLIFAFAPGQLTPAWIVNHDKFSHMVVFFALSILLSLAIPSLSLVQHSLFLLSFAVLIELVQFLFVGRGFSIEDLAYDFLGILVFYSLVFWAKYKDDLKQFFLTLIRS
jgi:VanZ family protein